MKFNLRPSLGPTIHYIPVPAGAVYARESNVFVNGSAEFANNHADVWGGKHVRDGRC